MSGVERYPAVVGPCRHRTDFELFEVCRYIGAPPPVVLLDEEAPWRGDDGILRAVATARNTPQAAAHLRKHVRVDAESADDWCRRYRWHVDTGRLFLSEAA